MDEIPGLTPFDPAGAQLVKALEEANETAVRYGLELTKAQMASIAEQRAEALENSGRVEFGRSAAPALVREFCDSPYITRENFEETILDLLDTFYYFKNESNDLIPDDELISLMKHHFDTTCQGSVDYLNGMTIEEPRRTARDDTEPDGEDEPVGGK